MRWRDSAPSSIFTQLTDQTGGSRFQKPRNKCRHFVEPIVMHPMTRIFKRDHFDFVKMLERAVLADSMVVTIARIDNQHRAADRPPQRHGVFVGNTEGRKARV